MKKSVVEKKKPITEEPEEVFVPAVIKGRIADPMKMLLHRAATKNARGGLAQAFLFKQKTRGAS